MAKPRRKFATIRVVWADHKLTTYVTDQVGTISQRYRQLNFITSEGTAVAINLVNTKSVEVESPDFDFNECNET
ncbi:MAG: hypothetical protein ACWGQW_04845 [bacterium]